MAKQQAELEKQKELQRKREEQEKLDAEVAAYRRLSQQEQYNRAEPFRMGSHSELTKSKVKSKRKPKSKAKSKTQSRTAPNSTMKATTALIQAEQDRLSREQSALLQKNL